MSVSVRLALYGKKNQPFYRIVVCETRYKRNGKYKEALGYYNPNLKPPVFKIDSQKLEKWIKNGAIVSDGLRKLLKKQPTL